MRGKLTLLTILSLATGVWPAMAQAQSEPDGGRATFDREICAVDELSPAQCDCAWSWLSAKLSPGDLRLALLLTASGSADTEVVRKADAQLDKHGSSDKRRDRIASEFSALVIDAEDACEGR